MKRLTFRAGALVCALGSLIVSVTAAQNRIDPPVNKQTVNRAVERGALFLKETQEEDGSWRYNGGIAVRTGKGKQQHVQDWTSPMDVGVASLAGLALLEADVKPSAPCIQNAAAFVRKGVAELTMTHCLGAAILFLDRLNEVQDVEPIKLMAARLVAGQNKEGGWGYSCPKLPEREVRKLNYAAEDQYRKAIGKLTLQLSTSAGGSGVGFTEQSTSEFAILGLWVARRHQVPVAVAMNTYEKMCRDNQNSDGSFPYMTRNGGYGTFNYTTPCMTCAGLLGMLTCNGLANENALLKYAKSKDGPAPAPGKGLRDLGKDPVITRGMVALERLMNDPPRDPGRDQLERRQGPGPGMHWAARRRWDADSSFVYMSLWAVERVAVAFNKDTIGQVDWYNWGARKLLAWQEQDGGWASNMQAPQLDTAFAILFLRKAEPVPGLRTVLTGEMPPPREPPVIAASATARE